MKLTTVTHVTVDGVMQGLGGPEEDRRDGFERGGWALPLFVGETETALEDIFQRADAFLLGRWTYEVFAGSWGRVTDPGNRIAGPLNTRPKYVASTTVTEPEWAGTTVVAADGDLAAAVRELKAKGDGEVQVHGSLSVVRRLLAEGLVDEMVLLTYPVVLGQGLRLFPDRGGDLGLRLVGSRATEQGVTIQVYRPAGRPQYATA
jgi:dihydrofolate reductase